MNNDKKTIVSSLIWKLLERIGVQGVQFIVAIVLARLLLPSDYGAITMITIFIALSDNLIQSGFSTSLIQKKNADELDFSSVFYITLLIALVLYLILFFTAPIIANFYNMPIIKNVLRVLSINLFIGAINSVQNAKIARDMKFRKLFTSSLFAVFASGFAGIFLAYKGYGVWALVAQQIVNQFISTIVLWFISGWKPKLMFSFERVKGLFSFGWKMMVSHAIDNLYRNLYNLVIGKVFNSETLGLYNKGEQFPKLISVNVDGAIGSVMLPAYSKEQDRKDKLKKLVKRTITTSSLLMFPMMAGLAATAPSIVLILLTSKWNGCVIYMQIMCIIYALYSLNTANLHAIKAVGKSDYYLKLEITKKVIGVIAVVATVRYGIMCMVIVQVLVNILYTIINMIPGKKLLNYNLLEQIKDIMPSLLISLFMYFVVSLFNLLVINVYLKLFIQIIIGLAIYICLNIIFKIESYYYVLNTIKGFFSNKKHKTQIIC